MILIIDKHCSLIESNKNCLKLHHENGCRRVPLKKLEMVAVYGNPTFASDVLHALSDANIPTQFTSTHGAGQNAFIANGAQLIFRLQQHRLARQDHAGLPLAKWLVEYKRQSYALALAKLDVYTPSNSKDKNEFIQHMQRCQDSIAQAASLPALLGVEGQLAHAWFSLLSQQLPIRWRFAGRNRRPPKDPINAMLSLGYTMLGKEVRQAVIGHGLDQALGFLHAPYPGRESLALDLTEPFRSAVDAFVLELIFEQKLQPKDFSFHHTHGCRLAKKRSAI